MRRATTPSPSSLQKSRRHGVQGVTPVEAAGLSRRRRRTSADRNAGIEQQLAVDSQAASSNQRPRVTAARVRADKALEHVGDTISVRVGADPKESTVELEPGDLLAAEFADDDRPPTLELGRGA